MTSKPSSLTTSTTKTTAAAFVTSTQLLRNRSNSRTLVGSTDCFLLFVVTYPQAQAKQISDSSKRLRQSLMQAMLPFLPLIPVGERRAKSLQPPRRNEFALCRSKSAGAAVYGEILTEVEAECALTVHQARKGHLPSKAPPPLLPTSLVGGWVPSINELELQVWNGLDESERVMYGDLPLAITVNFLSDFGALERSLSDYIGKRVKITYPVYTLRSDKVMTLCAVKRTKYISIIRCTN